MIIYGTFIEIFSKKRISSWNYSVTEHKWMKFDIIKLFETVNFCQLFHFDLHVFFFFLFFFSVILSKRWLKVTATAIFSFSIVISFNVARLNVF